MGIAAEGDSCAELFRQAALGLLQIITTCDDLQPLQELLIEVRGEDREELLVNWLGELLYLLESRQFLPALISIKEISEQRLLADVRGETLDPERHALEREVKAVTFHQLRVEETADGWRAQVYVDL